VTPFSIRRAVPGDAAALAKTAARLFHEAFAASNSPENMQRYLASAFHEAQQRAELTDPRNHAFLLHSTAIDDAQLMGYAILRDGDHPPAVTTPRPLQLWRFYLDETLQGQGAAAALMQHVVSHARVLAAGSLWLTVWEHNPRAIRFYQKQGFAVAGEASFFLGDEAQTDLLLVATL
jgi:ribosomal protein S18 acetylase RimI-like enzyme